MLIDVELLKENEDGSAVYSFNLSEDMKDAFVRFGIMQAIKAGIEAAKELAPDYEGKKAWVGLSEAEMYEAVRPLCYTESAAKSQVAMAKEEYLAIEAALKKKNL